MNPIVIITALSLEFSAVRAHLDNCKVVSHDQGTLYEQGKFSFGGHTLDVAIVEAGQGNDATAVATERAIQLFKPKIIFFVGVAGGIKGCNLGDVVVANEVHSYEGGKDGETFLARGKIGHASPTLLNWAKMEARKVERGDLVFGAGSTVPPQVLVGHIAAGEKVLASTDSPLYKFLREHYNSCVAVEMEGRGFSEAIRVNPSVMGLVIRGISDLLQGKEEADASGSQVIAARHAAAFAFQVLGAMAAGGAIESKQDAQWTPQESDQKTPVFDKLDKNKLKPSSQVPDEDLKYELKVLLQYSFEYCLWRKQYPQHNSNTSVHFYGIGFDKDNPRVIESIVVQSIRNEYEHLRQVLGGTRRSLGKPEGKEQIADEIVDMIRQLFILAIAVGVEDWHRIKWIEKIQEASSRKYKNKPPYEYATSMLNSYDELSEMNLRKLVEQEKIIGWIENSLFNLGGIANSQSIYLRDIYVDLYDRIFEKRDEPHATANNPKHGVGPGTHFVCKIYFKERPGAYRDVLFEFARNRIEIWKSVSRTVVWGELAECIMLVYVDRKISEIEADAMVNDIKKHFTKESNFSNDLPLVCYWERYGAKNFESKNEGEFIAVVSSAINNFDEGVENKLF